MDLVATGLGVARGLPVLCDVTCVSPVTGAGFARGGCLRVDGGAVAAAQQRCHEVDYPEVDASRAARLYCLGVEVFGRWSADSLSLVRGVARERVAGFSRRIARSVQTRLLRRWWGLLGTAVQLLVARAVLRGSGSDLADVLLERPPRVGDLPV